MFTIRIGNKRVKILNWLIFLSLIFLLLYFLGTLVFCLPVFNNVYSYTIKKENYEIKAKAKFKHAWLKCNIKEEYKIISNDKKIIDYQTANLIKDGFKKKNNVLIRRYKKNGLCKDDIKYYKKVHDKKYVDFKLLGEDTITIKYGDEYKDQYVKASINGVDIRNIELVSTLNEMKIGNYITTYILKIDDKYKQYLYRKIKIKDTTKPEINLSGDTNITLSYGDRYIEPGFEVTDNYDGDITNRIKIKNDVDSKKSGIYDIVYKVCDTSNNCSSVKRTVTVKENTKEVSIKEPVIEQKGGITYVDGILLVNKKYGLPKSYDPGVNEEALKMVKQMQKDAEAIGLNLPIVSSYRSYKTQEKLHASYVKKDGEEKASTYSALPGHSEHQTGLAFDLGSTNSSFQYTDEAKWLSLNAHLYGFIIRYPKDKTDITGYIYEPWHVRYLGKETAKKVWQSTLSLEEYLGIN